MANHPSGRESRADRHLPSKTKWGARPLPSSDDALRDELVSNRQLYDGNVTNLGEAMGKARCSDGSTVRAGFHEVPRIVSPTRRGT